MEDDINPKKWQFGDTIVNDWASADNPTRTGFFVRRKVSQGKQSVEMTDGRGSFWVAFADQDHKLSRSALSTIRLRT